MTVVEGKLKERREGRAIMGVEVNILKNVGL